MAGEKNPTGNINTVNTAGVAIYDTAGFLKAARNGGKTDFNSLVDMVQDAQFSWIQKSGLLVTGQTRSNGSMMTYQVVSNDFEISARNAVLATKVAGDVNAGSVSQNGIAMRFQVSVPASAINGPNDPALKTITPYDPTTLPKDGVIRFSSADYSKYYGTLGAFGLAGDFQTAKGDAYGYSIKNLGGNKIEVYAGPVTLLDAVNGVEASKAFLSAGISRHDQLAGAALNKAVFDIGTEQGKAAYQAFLLTGRMPEHDNKALGISGVRMIGYVSASSVSQLTAELEPGIAPVPKLPEWDPWKLRGITGTLVTVTNPNTGKTDWSLRKQYDEGPILTTTRRFDTGGKEDLSARQYTFEVKIGSKEAATLLGSLAFTSLKNQGWRIDAEKGDTVRITLNETQMQQLMKLAALGDDNAKRLNGGVAPVTGNLSVGAAAKDSVLFADYLAKSWALGGNSKIPDFLEQLAKLADRAAARGPGSLNNATYAPLPGNVQVESPVPTSQQNAPTR